MQVRLATGFTALTHRFAHASSPSDIQPSENRLGRVDVLRRLLHAASFAHPGMRKQLRRRAVTHFARCAFHLGAFRVWFGDPANPALRETLAQRPSLIMCVGVPKGIRTPVTAVKGRCPRPLDDGDAEKANR
jgi:hypothetical protein